MRGVTDINKGYVCVGSSTGNILILRTPSPDGEGIELQHTLDACRSPITALAASDDILVGGNESGEVIAFDIHNAFEIRCKFPGSRFPCTSLCIRDDTVMASYSTGHIRVFNATSCEMTIEIAAHLRNVTALALHPSMDLLASVGEDQFLLIWRIPRAQPRGSRDVELVYNEKLDNRILTGVSFMDSNRVGVAAFDEDDLTVFRMEK